MSGDWTAIVPYAVWTRAEDAATVEVVVERYDDGGDAYALVVAGPWRAADAAALRDAPDAPWPGGLVVAEPVPGTPHAWRLLRPARAAPPEYAAFLLCASRGPQRFGPTPDAPVQAATAPPAGVAPGGAGTTRPWVPLRVPPPDEATLRLAIGDALRATVEGWQPALVALS